MVHASCVAVDGRAAIFLGPSGSGKSALALQLMAFGAELVADDRTTLTRQQDGVDATCPPGIQGLIEARFVGLLGAGHVSGARLSLVVDMGRIETQRLPPRRDISVLGYRLPLLHKSETAHFSAAVLHYLRHGRTE